MLEDSFYKFKAISENSSEGIFSYEITFVEANKIFEGHFPNQAVVPGVTLIQIVKELMSHAYNCSFTILNIINSKFLQVIDPKAEKNYRLHITCKILEDLYLIDVSMSADDAVAFKMKAKLRTDDE